VKLEWKDSFLKYYAQAIPLQAVEVSRLIRHEQHQLVLPNQHFTIPLTIISPSQLTTSTNVGKISTTAVLPQSKPIDKVSNLGRKIPWAAPITMH
jgi:hypothetical protein